MGKTVDISGKRFGLLTALSRVLPRPKGQSFRWLCVCDCGVEKGFPYSSLYSGKSLSCGRDCVLRKKRLRDTPTHMSWKKMLCRAARDGKHEKGYENVSVCDRWVPSRGGSFDNFIDDMGERPEGTSLNRIRGALIYSKETCEWATFSMQSFDKQMFIGNKSGRTGVRYRKEREKWEARITVDNKIIILYYGDCFETACKIRSEAEIKYYGFTKE